MASVRFEDPDGIKYGIERTGNVPHSKIVAPVDGSTEAVNIIDYAHHEIHSGSGYTNTSTASVGANSTMRIMVVTPNTAKYAHMFQQAIVEAAFCLSIYEDATVAASGIWMQAYNRNRNEASAPGLMFYANPTVANQGTLIMQTAAGSGQKAGGEVRASHEIIMKRNTIYLYEVLNLSAQIKWVASEFNWYNHMDRD